MAESIKIYEYRIVEVASGGFICCVLKGDEILGVVHKAQTIESMYAWFRLVLGDYPEMHGRTG